MDIPLFVTDWLFTAWLGKPLWLWLFFIALVGILLIADLGFFSKGREEIGVRESLIYSTAYIGLGLAFGVWVSWYLGLQAGIEYFTGFALEKALAIDNVFVIAMIFSFLAIPRQYQHRVLFWGILGAIVLRAIMIGFGASIVTQFHWVLYIFAAFLIVTGVKMLLMANKTYDVASNPVLKFLQRHARITDKVEGEHFIVRQIEPRTGRLLPHITPLFVALILVELADVVFAVDSVPAIFAVTTDPFIVYTSNIFAILGLRAIYFALAAMVHRFHYLKYALAVVLIFIGAKIFVADLLGADTLPPLFSLAVTLAILAAGIGYSLWRTRGDDEAALSAKHR